MATWPELTPAKRDELLKLKETHTIEELASKMGMYPPTLGRRLREWRRYRNFVPTEDDIGPGKDRVDPNKSPFDDFDFSIGRPWVLTGDWMVIGDIHVPFTDTEFASLVIKVAKKWGITNLLIAGDLFSMDQFSHYDEIIKPPTWAQERDFAKLLFQEWLSYFTQIKMVMGNHDRRLQKFTSGAFDENDIISLIVSRPDVIRISNFGYCYVDSPMGRWLVTHQKNYSINQLTVADAHAQKYLCHVITHHEHHLAKGWDRYKNFVVVNNGTLANWEDMAYVYLDTSKSAGMTKGFVRLQGGVAHLYGEYPYTNWEEVFPEG